MSITKMMLTCIKTKFQARVVGYPTLVAKVFKIMVNKFTTMITS